MASPRRFLNHVFIIFIWEKERSTEVLTGIAKHIFARVLKFGHIVSNIELVDNYITIPLCHPSVEPFYLRKVFHSVSTSELDEERIAGITNSSPTIILAESSLR